MSTPRHPRPPGPHAGLWTPSKPALGAKHRIWGPRTCAQRGPGPPAIFAEQSQSTPPLTPATVAARPGCLKRLLGHCGPLWAGLSLVVGCDVTPDPCAGSRSAARQPTASLLIAPEPPIKDWVHLHKVTGRCDCLQRSTSATRQRAVARARLTCRQPFDRRWLQGSLASTLRHSGPQARLRRPVGAQQARCWPTTELGVKSTCWQGGPGPPGYCKQEVTLQWHHGRHCKPTDSHPTPTPGLHTPQAYRSAPSAPAQA